MSLVYIQWILLVIAAIGGLASLFRKPSTAQTSSSDDDISSPVDSVDSVRPSTTIRGVSAPDVPGNDAEIPDATPPLVTLSPFATNSDDDDTSSDSSTTSSNQGLILGAFGVLGGFLLGSNSREAEPDESAY